ncbi:hypothetical protein [Emcibacter sp.]|uniref:tetratricopeptide repeat protein n=1 Tax=Emcibacter sp. TaxID=1979954 RepID=UPI002AA94C66|nr:hypothetical protein [Emcibacter sp.]
MFLTRLRLPHFLLMFVFLGVSQIGYAAEKIPLGHEGRRDSAVFNGHQNMPVVLYGVAIKWNSGCLKGKTDKCLRLARAFEIGEGDLKLEIRTALGYYLEACKKGAGEGCSRAAEIIRAGDAGFTDEKLTRETAQRGCNDLDDQTSCARLAESLASTSSDENRSRAEQLIERACQKGNSEGCRLKAVALFYDRNNAESPAEAVELFTKFCKKKQAWGCTGLAEARDKGRGVKADPKKASAAARKGCLEAEGNTIPACALYGRYLVEDNSEEKISQGVKILAKACLAGDAFACNDAGELGWKQGAGNGLALWEIPLYFRDACDMDLAEGCLNLSAVYKNGFNNVSQDDAAMIALLDKACALGSSEACGKVEAFGKMAKIYRRRTQPIDPSLPAKQQLSHAIQIIDHGKGRAQKNRSLDTVVRLMHEGVAEAEWVLAGWLYYGKPGLIDQINKSDGFILFENAARQQHVEAAKWVGMAYWYGDGVPLDRQKGKGYMALAAARGDEMAIAIYRSMEAQKIRDNKARRAKEMAEAAERRKNDWAYQFGLAAAAWAEGRRNTPYSYGGGSGRLASESWRRSQQALDKQNWNNAVNYTVGRTSACPMSNPYC